MVRHTTSIARARRLAVTGALIVALAVPLAGAHSSPAAAACPAPGGRPIPRAADPVPKAQVVFRGWGWGHGLGMSQYGAQGAARLGCSAGEILATYYRGTAVRTRTDRRSIGVRMLDDVGRAAILVEQGRRILWRNGPTRVGPYAGGRWQVRRTSATTAQLLHKGTVVWSGTVHPTGLRAMIANRVVRLNSITDTYGKLPMRLRDDEIRFTLGSGGMDVVKWFLDGPDGAALDQYLFGLAEVPSSWPAAALRAQAIAARTYAYKRNGILLPTTADQNYAGYDQQLADQAAGGHFRAAVTATTGRVIVDGAGNAIDAVYSSSMGGRTEDKVYSWGGTAIPYLRSVDDSVWDRASDNPGPMQSWTRGFTRAHVARALGFTSLTRISVAVRGSAARLDGVRVQGIKGGVSRVQFFPGFTVRNALGLLSPGFHIVMNP